MTSSSGQPVTLHLPGPVAIPVGHRVQVTVVEYKEYGPMPDRPLVTDLETGITFGELSLFTSETGQLTKPPTALLSQYREHAHWGGRVLLCQILHRETGWLQTTLVIEADPSSATPYR